MQDQSTLPDSHEAIFNHFYAQVFSAEEQLQGSLAHQPESPFFSSFRNLDLGDVCEHFYRQHAPFLLGECASGESGVLRKGLGVSVLGVASRCKSALDQGQAEHLEQARVMLQLLEGPHEWLTYQQKE